MPQPGKVEKYDSGNGEEENENEETKRVVPESWQLEVVYTLKHILNFWENTKEDKER
jgi:hypothetical protein